MGGLPVAAITPATGSSAESIIYYHHDVLGSTVAATAPGQADAEAFTYGEFGAPGAGNALTYRFAGYRLDAETGLYFVGARYYSPVLGRFLQTDPIGLKGGTNLYGYAGNDPLSLTDPTGLCSQANTGTGGLWGNVNSALNSASNFIGKVGDNPYFQLSVTGVSVLGSLVPAAEGNPGPLEQELPAFQEAAESAGLRFSQTTASPWFGLGGPFAGQTISDVAAQLRSGTLSTAAVPVNVVTIGANTLIVNTRSSLALSPAGIPQSSWNLLNANMPNDLMKDFLTRLSNNGLTTAGTPVLRITGSGSGASTYFGAGTIPRPWFVNKILWKMSVPVTGIIRGPFVKELPKRQCEISFSIEADDGSERIETLLFEAVESYKCTYMTSLGAISGDWRRQSYGSIISISESPWLREVERSYIEYCTAFRLVPKTLQHLMITFDDGPCYEFICASFKVL